MNGKSTSIFLFYFIFMDEFPLAKLVFLQRCSQDYMRTVLLFHEWINPHYNRMCILWQRKLSQKNGKPSLNIFGDGLKPSPWPSRKVRHRKHLVTVYCSTVTKNIFSDGWKCSVRYNVRTFLFCDGYELSQKITFGRTIKRSDVIPDPIGVRMREVDVCCISFKRIIFTFTC